MLNRNKQTVEVQLKHMALQPETIKCQANTNILLKITNNNSCSFESRDRKFLFLLEETDQESPPLTEGQEYYFAKALEQPGIFSLQCLNYTKIRCSIEVQKEESERSEKQCEQEIAEIVRAPSPLCDLTEVTEQRDEEIKDTNEGMPQDEEKNNSKSEFADYERILSGEDMQYDYMPNKYLKYFKEQFKLWRDFFDQPAETVKHSSSRKEQGASSGSLSLSERQSEKEESVISHLRSQQEMSQVQEEQLNKIKIMKKTNSEYCFNVDRQTEKNHPSDSKRKQINTNTSSPNPRTEQSQADSFVDWAWSWADGQKLGEVKIQRMGDRHLVRQWLTFLQNKFKISEIMYG